MNFELIWRRVLSDHKQDHFLKNNLEIEILEKDFNSWSKQLKSDIETGVYIPKMPFICDVPKAKGLIRPGTQLSVSDNVYYTALISDAYKLISNFLSWSQEVVDYAYILTGDNKTPTWLKNHFHGWSPFRESSLRLISEGYQYVIITDITGFYENINHQTLQSDLIAANVPTELAIKIIKALQKWSIVNGRGIPQSCSPSHILAKLYLNTVDIALQNSGYKHLRYVDDIRVFCKTKAEAKQALVELCKLMRERGLTLNSAKTKIYSADEAKSIIDGVSITIEEIKKQLKENNSIFDFTNYFENEYVNIETINELFRLSEKPSKESIEVIEEAFRLNFLEANKEFDKTLFRFLLSRLGEARSKFAIDYCYAQFETRPEEITTILTYYLKCGAFIEALDAVIDFFESGEALYSYQNYMIINWFIDVYEEVPPKLLNIVRGIAFNSNQPSYLKMSAIRFIGQFGNIADIDRLQQLYALTTDDLEKANIILSVKRMETGRRNTFYSKVQSDCAMSKIAVEIAKQ